MLFNLKKQNKNYDKNSYIFFLKKLLVDEKIKEEIINQIEIFAKEGTLVFDGNNLYGKIIKKEGNDYLEIKYENTHFYCNYTKWNIKCSINISQIN